MKKWIVETENLTKTYQAGDIAVTALDGVDLRVAAGEFVAIIGKSGSGKSTLLHMLGGLDVPSTGRVVVDGNDLTMLDRTQLALFRRRRVGFIFQQYNLIPDLNVWDNIIFPLALDGVAIDTEFIDELLTALHIADKRDRMPSQLSGGEQQRVAIARALINKPKILLADEPTGNLDANNAWEIMKLMEEINEQGTTVVVVTHNLEIVKAMNKRVITMQKGVVVDDTASDHYGKDTSVEQDDDLFDDFLDDGGDDDYAN